MQSYNINNEIIAKKIVQKSCENNKKWQSLLNKLTAQSYNIARIKIFGQFIFNRVGRVIRRSVSETPQFGHPAHKNSLHENQRNSIAALCSVPIYRNN